MPISDSVQDVELAARVAAREPGVEVDPLPEQAGDRVAWRCCAAGCRSSDAAHRPVRRRPAELADELAEGEPA